ncbi:MAG: HAMP domain-containing sensor histidine kinase [Polyangiaceae bacterium]
MNRRAAAPVKFLLVDDLEENLLALEAILARDGLTLLTASSATEALEVLLVHDVALALLDVQMPDMDGFELAELMRGSEKTRHIPIIFVTAGIRDRDHIFQGYDAGAVDFLFKPIEPRILQHKAKTFFDLYRQRQELADTLRLNEELLAVVGHDIRNPLNVILMTAGLLESGARDPGTQRAVERLRTSGKRIVHIIEDLLDLSRARLGGGIPVERKRIDLVPVLRRTVAELQTTNPDRAIELHAGGELWGDWDEARMEQVFSNLVGNAVRHGAADTLVVVAAAAEGGSAVATVHNGGAVPEDKLPRLFEPFHFDKGRSQRTEGLGLGLYIVDQIVRAHGGRVEVTSTIADGTTVRVELPRS